MKIHSSEQIQYFKRLLENKISFALARYADGERLFMEGKKATGIDGWSSPEGINPIGQRLRASIARASQNGTYVGISCDSTDEGSKIFFLNLLKDIDTEKITFSNLFVNANYKYFREQIIPALFKKKIILICNSSGLSQGGFFWDTESFIDIIPVGADCVSFWQKSGETFERLIKIAALKHSDALFLFAAGPISSIIIPELWDLNNLNTYIDVGSALDPYMFHKSTRPYQIEGHPDQSITSEIEVSDLPREHPSPGIAVILNIYKRYDNTQRLIQSIQNQTSPPVKFIYCLTQSPQVSY